MELVALTREEDAFILARPLGDTLTDSIANHGMRRCLPSFGVIALFIILCILLDPQRPDEHPGADKAYIECNYVSRGAI